MTLLNPQTTETNKPVCGWHTYDDKADLAIVFVHGFFSDPATCWTGPGEITWPDLMASDTRAPHASIYLGQYYTALDSHSYSVQDCAKELFGTMNRTDTEGRPPVLNFPEIVFVCHSLGGIVVRQLLVANADAFAGKRIGLCLMGSPSMGSDYASAFGVIAALWQNKIARQLKTNNDFLRDLDERFLKFMELRAGSFFGTEAMENRPPSLISFLPPLFPKIVADSSASRYFSTRAMMHGTTHSTIVKPTSLTHPSHAHLLDFLTGHFHNRASGRAKGQSLLRETDVLFEVYEPRNEPYYLERAFDRNVKTTAEVRSVWLYGRSGAGKTCSLRRLALQHDGPHITVCLSQHQTMPTKEDVIREIFETLVQHGLAENTPSPSFSKLINVLCALAEEYPALVLTFDEVPATPADGNQEHPVLELIQDLLSNAAGRGKRLRILASSFTQPNGPIGSRHLKLGELLENVEIEEWSDAELSQLVVCIEQTLPAAAVSVEQRATLLEAAQNNPRFIKTFYKTRWSRRHTSDSFEKLLQATRQQLAY